MGFITGCLVIIGLPIMAGMYLDSRFNHGRTSRRFKRDRARMLATYWSIGLLPVFGLVFLFIAFSVLGKILLWMI